MGWTEELKALEFLRKDIIYLQYAQKDVKSMYSLEAYKMFQRMRSGIYETASHILFRELHQTKLIRITRMVNPVERNVKNESNESGESKVEE